MGEYTVTTIGTSVPAPARTSDVVAIMRPRFPALPLNGATSAQSSTSRMLFPGNGYGMSGMIL